MSRRSWIDVASWSAIAASAVLAGSAAAMWAQWSVRTGVASISVVVAAVVAAGVAVATRATLRDAFRGDDSRAAGRLVGFVMVTEVLAVPVGGLVLVAAVLVSALCLLFAAGRVTQQARHHLWSLPGDVSGDVSGDGSGGGSESIEVTGTDRATSLSARERG